MFRIVEAFLVVMHFRYLIVMLQMMYVKIDVMLTEFRLHYYAQYLNIIKNYLRQELADTQNKKLKLS